MTGGPFGFYFLFAGGSFAAFFSLKGCFVLKSSCQKDYKPLKKEGKKASAQWLPMLLLEDEVLLPYGRMPLTKEGISSCKDTFSALRVGSMVGVLSFERKKGKKVFAKVGVFARVFSKKKLSCGKAAQTLEGVGRFYLQSYKEDKGSRGPMGLVLSFEDAPFKRTASFAALEKALYRSAKSLLSKDENSSDTLKSNLKEQKDGVLLCHLLAPQLSLSRKEKLSYLAFSDARKRIRWMLSKLNKEMALRDLSLQISSQVEEDLADSERRRYLKEQLSLIKKELGEESLSLEVETKSLEKALLSRPLPPLAAQAVKEELYKLSLAEPGSPEHAVSHAYLTFMSKLPFESEKPAFPSISKAARLLNQGHAGLASVKERILEYISVFNHTGKAPGQILLIEGPPGVGKTSLVKSIAKALGRPFAKVALGGVKDEGEIRGHRRTYIGSMPGKILDALARTSSLYPVILLDEIDKVTDSKEGGVSGALLELLDGEQNREFSDHYLSLPFDLSNVLFIATANNSAAIEPALLDRMESIELSSYSEREKLEIAKKHIVPEVRAMLDLRGTQLRFQDDAILELIRGYTLEGGVRQLKREISSIGRKVVRQIVGRQFGIKSLVKKGDLESWLGPRKYLGEQGAINPEIGSCVGLAYTDIGGDVLLVESALTANDQKDMRLTGSLGSVIKESAQTARTFLLSEKEALSIDTSLLVKNQLHIHLPDGATPKDGPSAGLAIFSAIYSLLRKKPLSSHLAMTGEITLRGRVLPVGGIKEKLLAASRYGMKVVIIPKGNEKEMLAMGEESLLGLKVILVGHVLEMIEYLD